LVARWPPKVATWYSREPRAAWGLLEDLSSANDSGALLRVVRSRAVRAGSTADWTRLWSKMELPPASSCSCIITAGRDRPEAGREQHE
jgi:hypothetical protein